MSGNELEAGKLASDHELSDYEEFDRKTFYLRPPIRDDFEDWLNLKKVTDSVFKEAETRPVYEAVVTIAMQNEDEVREELIRIMAAEGGE